DYHAAGRARHVRRRDGCWHAGNGGGRAGHRPERAAGPRLRRPAADSWPASAGLPRRGPADLAAPRVAARWAGRVAVRQPARRYHTVDLLVPDVPEGDREAPAAHLRHADAARTRLALAEQLPCKLLCERGLCAHRCGGVAAARVSSVHRWHRCRGLESTNGTNDTKLLQESPPLSQTTIGAVRERGRPMASAGCRG